MKLRQGTDSGQQVGQCMEVQQGARDVITAYTNGINLPLNCHSLMLSMLHTRSSYWTQLTQPTTHSPLAVYNDILSLHFYAVF